MFTITPEVILQNASITQYNKGREYLRNRRIKSVQFNQEKLAFTATVLGTVLYHVHLHFNQQGDLENSDCTCSEFADGTGYCRHIIAVLLLIETKDRQGFFHELKFRHAAHSPIVWASIHRRGTAGKRGSPVSGWPGIQSP